MVFSLLLFALHLLIVNFFRVVFANECKFVKSNYLNFGVVCDLFIFYFASLGILYLFCHNI
jgi:hypothetical protein